MSTQLFNEFLNLSNSQPWLSLSVYVIIAKRNARKKLLLPRKEPRKKGQAHPKFDESR